MGDVGLKPFGHRACVITANMTTQPTWASDNLKDHGEGEEGLNMAHSYLSLPVELIWPLMSNKKGAISLLIFEPLKYYFDVMQNTV